MKRNVDSAVRYRIDRDVPQSAPRVLHQARSLSSCQTFAKHRLSKPATIIELAMLPLGCEIITRVGTINIGGTVRWRR